MSRRHAGGFDDDDIVALDAVVTELAELRRSLHAMHAREAQLLHAGGKIADNVLERSRGAAAMPHRSVAAEFGAVLRVSDRAVQRMMSEAEILVTMFPGVLSSLSAGSISRSHATVILEAGAHIDDDAARRVFEATVLEVAERESASRLRPIAKLLGEKLHPRTLTERHAAAAADRAVRVVDLADGMADLIATLPATIAHGALDRLSQMAHEVLAAFAAEARAGVGAGGDADAADTGECVAGELDTAALPAGEVDAGARSADELDAAVPAARDMQDPRRVDELRADILADLLLTSDPTAHVGATGLGAIHARVQVTVPVMTLIGRDDSPASLAGVGPIDAETARRLAGHATGWDRVLTHPISGAVLTVDRYRPSEDLKRTLRVRDQHCRFPGCRLATWKCDIDHTIDAAHGGPTHDGNLAHLCRRHHTLKHESAWSVTQKPGGILEWRSPTGRVYPDIPTTTVMFRPDPVPPPF